MQISVDWMATVRGGVYCSPAGKGNFALLPPGFYVLEPFVQLTGATTNRDAYGHAAPNNKTLETN